MGLTRQSVSLNECLIKNEIKILELDWSNSGTMRQSFDVILAADFSYNSRSCQSFFKCIKYFMSKGLQYCLLALEERHNFMVDTMSVELF